MPAVPSDANALVRLPLGNSFAHCVDDARCFMSGNPRILKARPRAFFRKHVTVADATGLNLDPHLSCARLGNLGFDNLEISSGLVICATFIGATAGTEATLSVAINPPGNLRVMVEVVVTRPRIFQRVVVSPQ